MTLISRGEQSIVGTAVTRLPCHFVLPRHAGNQSKKCNSTEPFAGVGEACLSSRLEMLVPLGYGNLTNAGRRGQGQVTRQKTEGRPRVEPHSVTTNRCRFVFGGSELFGIFACHSCDDKQVPVRLWWAGLLVCGLCEKGIEKYAAQSHSRDLLGH